MCNRISACSIFIILILLPDREYSVDISGSRYSESVDTAAFSLNNGEMYRYVTEPVSLPRGRYFLKVNYECAETSTIIYVYNGEKAIQSISLTAEIIFSPWKHGSADWVIL